MSDREWPARLLPIRMWRCFDPVVSLEPGSLRAGLNVAVRIHALRRPVRTPVDGFDKPPGPWYTELQ
jgi:hypothetical protein